MPEENLFLPALQNSNTPALLAPEFAMTPDEAAELGEVSARPLIVRFDGRTGVFRNIDTEETSDQLTGAILGVTFSQAWFPRDEDAESWPKWICRAEDVRNSPILHPELTSAQRGEAQARGAGGSCATCPLRAFGDGRPVCTGSINLLWADTQLGEVATVQAPGTSITAMKHFLNWFARKRVSTMCKIVSLSPEKQSRGTRTWSTMQARVVGDVSVENVVKLRQLRQEHITTMSERVRAATEAEASVPEIPADQLHHPLQDPAPPASFQAPRPAGRGVNLVPTQDPDEDLAGLVEQTIMSGPQAGGNGKKWGW